MSGDKYKQYFGIETSAIIKVIIAGVLVFLGFYLFDILLAILTAVVIAAAVNPAANWFGRFGLPRVVSVLLVYVISILIFAGVLYFFVPSLVADLSGIVYGLPRQINNFIQDNPSWEAIFAFSGADNGGQLTIQDIISKGLFESPLPSNVYDFVMAIFNGLVSFILIIVISFYLAVQKNGTENFLRIIAPLHHEEYILDLWSRTEAKIGRWIQGQLLLAAIIGPMVFIGLSLMQIEYAMILAIVAAVFELIPVFGPVLAAVPAVLIAFTGNATLGLMVIGFYVLVQQFENHLIYPLVVKKVIGVNPLIVIISLVVGYEIAGVLGMILAIPAVTLLMEYLHDLEKQRKIANQNAG